MDPRILDLVSTQYISEKMSIEIDLERLINNPPVNISANELADNLKIKVGRLSKLLSEIQTWEGIMNQLNQSKTPEKGDNK
jgi:hypothetical protein